MTLRSTTNEEEVEEDIVACFDDDDELSVHEGPEANFEHGQWWVLCASCGAAWSVVDVVRTNGEEALGFEEVAAGDDSCEENAQEDS